MLQIRKAENTDAEAIHNIHTRAVKEGCKECYSQEKIEGWLKNGDAKKS